MTFYFFIIKQNLGEVGSVAKIKDHILQKTCSNLTLDSRYKDFINE